MRTPEHKSSAESRAIDGLIRVGRVSSVNAGKHTARVMFEEDDDLVSYDLPVLVARPGDYSLPDVDAPVVCLMAPGSAGVGYVLGAIYTDADAPPLSDAGQRSVAGDDLRLGAADATDKVALAPATKTEIQKVLDYAQGIATAIQAGVPVPNDGGANLKATIIAALPLVPTLDEPAAEQVSAK